MNGSKRILIIEHDANNANETFALLKRDNKQYQIDIAHSLPEAIEKLQTIHFQCVVMGLSFPDIESDQAVGLVKTAGKESLLITIAEGNTRELETKVRAQGVHYYHIRSDNPTELKLAVRSVFLDANES